MERRQNNGERCRIIRQFLSDIPDDGMRIACCMYMRNYGDRAVCRQLNISRRQLETMKEKLAAGLLEAGIRL